jgi:hypothetical protein
LIKEDKLARVNYSFVKHQRELAQKKKKEEKRLNKLNKKNAQAKAGEDVVEGEPVVNP